MASIIEKKGLKYGVKTFLDEKDIEGGESIPESVRKNIQECSEFLVFLSPYSVGRPWVRVEIGAAWALGKRIVAVTDKVIPEEIPDIISQHKAIDLNSFDEYLEQLLRRAKKVGDQKKKRRRALEKQEQYTRFLFSGVGELRVFLSYAVVDRAYAQKVHRILSRHLNARMFTPEMLSAGEEWESKLKDEISKCDIFFIILSPNTIDSKWVLQELGAAWALDKPIIPVLTHREIFSKVPVTLKKVLAVEIKELGKPKVINKILTLAWEAAASASS